MSNGTTPQKIGEILDPGVQESLSNVDVYDDAEMNNALSEVFALYGATADFIEAIRKVFYDIHQPTPLALDHQDRERCIIALLASRGGQVTLAIHIYMALMLKVTPDEIANILFLTGVYTGTDNLAMGLFTLKKTLMRLNGLGKMSPIPPGPVVLKFLLADYGLADPPTWPPSA